MEPGQIPALKVDWGVSSFACDKCYRHEVEKLQLQYIYLCDGCSRRFKDYFIEKHKDVMVRLEYMSEIDVPDVKEPECE